MPTRAELLEPSRRCTKHLEELINNLRTVQKTGSLNIFSYQAGVNVIPEDDEKKLSDKLNDAKQEFSQFLDLLHHDEEWRECFTNADFIERSLQVQAERLDRVMISSNVLSTITQLENINNNLNMTLLTFEDECID